MGESTADYKSFEEYANDKNSVTTPNSPQTSRDVSRVALRRMETQCKRLGIEMQLFKQPNKNEYFMTAQVIDLFDYLDGYFFEKHRKQIIKKLFSAIPNNHLVEVRDRLLSALLSVGLSVNIVRKAVGIYEGFTGCPAVFIGIPASTLTYDAIMYWGEDYKYMIEAIQPSEWDIFAQSLEYEYRKIWRPQFVEFAREELRKFLAEKGRELPEVDDTVEMSCNFGSEAGGAFKYEPTMMDEISRELIECLSYSCPSAHPPKLSGERIVHDSLPPNPPELPDPESGELAGVD